MEDIKKAILLNKEGEPSEAIVLLHKKAMEERVLGSDQPSESVASFLKTKDFQEIIKNIKPDNVDQLKNIYSLFIVALSPQTAEAEEFINQIEWSENSNHFSLENVSTKDLLNAWSTFEDTSDNTDQTTGTNENLISSLFEDLDMNDGPSNYSSFKSSKNDVAAQIPEIDPGAEFVLEDGSKFDPDKNKNKKGQMAQSLHFVEAPKPILPNPLNAMFRIAERTPDLKKIQDLTDFITAKRAPVLTSWLTKIKPVTLKITDAIFEHKNPKPKDDPFTFR